MMHPTSAAMLLTVDDAGSSAQQLDTVPGNETQTGFRPQNASRPQTYTLYVTVHEARLAPFWVNTKLCTVCLPAATPDC
jgi:hypothetical protein